jgi:ABC-type glycerol-3-phosphate transport system substrate-binding protein
MRKADPDHFKSFALTGFVLNLDANLLVYDKKIFDDYGVPYPDENLTQEKLLELAKRLTGKDPVTGKDTYGFYIRANQNSIYRAHLAYLYSKDIKVVEYADKRSDTQFFYDSPGSIDAFRFVNELAKYCPRSFLEDRGIENFGTEDNDVAMYIDGDVPFKYETFKAIGLQDRYGFSYPPKLENGREGWSPYVGDNNIAIARNALNRDDSWAFLKWYVTDPGIADWKVRRGQVPNNKAALAAITKDNTYAAILSTMLDKYPRGFSPNSSEYLNTNIGAGLSILNKTLTAMWSGSITPEQAARQTQVEFIEQVR